MSVLVSNALFYTMTNTLSWELELMSRQQLHQPCVAGKRLYSLSRSLSSGRNGRCNYYERGAEKKEVQKSRVTTEGEGRAGREAQAWLEKLFADGMALLRDRQTESLTMFQLLKAHAGAARHPWQIPESTPNMSAYEASPSAMHARKKRERE